MRYYDTPSKAKMVFWTLIAIVFTFLIAYDAPYDQRILNFKTFILAGFACGIVNIWSSYYWEKTWSQEWNNLDEQLEEIRDKIDDLERMLQQ